MIKPEQIPDEVVEAAAKAVADQLGDDWDDNVHTFCGDDWQLTPDGAKEACRSIARAAIAAALNAWPSLEVFIFPAAMEKEGEQKRLGPEFEAAIFSDVEGLYEADKSEGEA
jgi:hypothetical protein